MKSDISYTKKLLRSSRIKIIGYFVLLLTAGFITISAGILDLIKDDKWRNPLIWLVISAFILGILYSKLLGSLIKWQEKINSKWYEENRRSHEGEVGEETFFGWADKLFDSRYHQFRNFMIPGNEFDIDLVVVGPKGIFMFEVKKSSNPVIFKNGNAFFAGTNRPLPYNPIIETAKHHAALSEYLKANGYQNESIHPALVMLADKVEFEGKPEVFLISNEMKLKERINYFQDNPIYTPEFCDKLSKLLNPNK